VLEQVPQHERVEAARREGGRFDRRGRELDDFGPGRLPETLPGHDEPAHRRVDPDHTGEPTLARGDDESSARTASHVEKAAGRKRSHERRGLLDTRENARGVLSGDARRRSGRFPPVERQEIFESGSSTRGGVEVARAATVGFQVKISIGLKPEVGDAE